MGKSKTPVRAIHSNPPGPTTTVTRRETLAALESEAWLEAELTLMLHCSVTTEFLIARDRILSKGVDVKSRLRLDAPKIVQCPVSG